MFQLICKCGHSNFILLYDADKVSVKCASCGEDSEVRFELSESKTEKKIGYRS